jgi:hypothetical protein
MDNIQYIINIMNQPFTNLYRIKYYINRNGMKFCNVTIEGLKEIYWYITKLKCYLFYCQFYQKQTTEVHAYNLRSPVLIINYIYVKEFV